MLAFFIVTEGQAGGWANSKTKSDKQSSPMEASIQNA
jgi:hypothetical protein